ncbi:hypothetical protein CRE_21897 [Caenorhabditis remanei]|uniref:Uncharacterized protein n=1 Tax=Caenorhabditis remanei TaxID=31234 RepID=E3MU77_CAERE|nr:hypothetical protein CRE_21897 [Caenorhabditis remanei]
MPGILGVPLIPLLLICRKWDTQTISEFATASRSSKKKVLESILPFFVASHNWKVEANRVTLKLTLEYDGDMNDQVPDEEDWNGEDGNCVFIFDDNEYNKIKRKFEGSCDSRIRSYGSFLQDGGSYYHVFDWDVIFIQAVFLMNTFEGTHELHILTNHVSEFVQIFQQREEPGHCEILEIGYEGMKENDFDFVLQQFETVKMLILDEYNGKINSHQTFNYNQIFFNNCSNIHMADLQYLQTPNIDLFNPTSLQSIDIVAFIHGWLISTDMGFERFRVEYVGMPNQLNLQQILSCIYYLPYNPYSRMVQQVHLDVRRVHHYAFLFNCTDSVDIYRADGTVASLISHKDSVYFVVWHQTEQGRNQVQHPHVEGLSSQFQSMLHI